MIDNKFVQIATYQYTSEAIIYKNKLEFEGVTSFLKDAYTVDSNPLYSNAIGGVKLLVFTKDFEKAKKILGEISQYSINDNGNLMSCPKCSSESIEMYTSITDIKSLLSFIFSWFVALLPIHAKYKYLCKNCKFEFSKP